MYQTNSHTNNVNFQIIGKFFVPCMPSLFLKTSIEYFLDKIDEFFVLRLIKLKSNDKIFASQALKNTPL